MIDDLVTRLRSPDCDGCDVIEAADEIERLRILITQIKSMDDELVFYARSAIEFDIKRKSELLEQIRKETAKVDFSDLYEPVPEKYKSIFKLKNDNGEDR